MRRGGGGLRRAGCSCSDTCRSTTRSVDSARSHAARAPPRWTPPRSALCLAAPPSLAVGPGGARQSVDGALDSPCAPFRFRLAAVEAGWGLGAGRCRRLWRAASFVRPAGGEPTGGAPDVRGGRRRPPPGVGRLPWRAPPAARRLPCRAPPAVSLQAARRAPVKAGGAFLQVRSHDAWNFPCIVASVLPNPAVAL